MMRFYLSLCLLLCGVNGLLFGRVAKLVKAKFSSSAGAVSLETGIGSTDAALKDGIARFYDKTSSIWLDVWGEDMHHGYYPSPKFRDHKAAQTLMIEQAVKFGFGFPSTRNLSLGFFDGKRMVDVGCGVGGSSRYIVKKYGGSAEGLSLSPYQIARAQEYSAKAGVEGRANYQVADAMSMPFPDNSFDLTWSMESGEHMPDKAQFLRELHRVTKPGGRIIIVTWCHRETDQKPLDRNESNLLRKISRTYFLPEWVPSSTYVKIAESLGMQDVRQDDWSKYVAPFWPAVIRSALRPRNFIKMLLSGWTTIKGALAAWWMRRGLKKGLIKFAIIAGKK